MQVILTEMPLYRAKKIDSDEYVVGFYHPMVDGDTYTHIIFSTNNSWNGVIVDETTLSIHFPDMLASDSDRLLPNGKKDLRIFASLSADGKGGDKIIEDGKYEDGFNPVFKPYFRKSSFSIEDLPQTPYRQYELHKYKIIGI